MCIALDQSLFCIKTGKGSSISNLQKDIHMAMAEGKEVAVGSGLELPESKRPCLREDPVASERPHEQQEGPCLRENPVAGERPCEQQEGPCLRENPVAGERPHEQQEGPCLREDPVAGERPREQQEGQTVDKSGGNFAKRRKVILLLSYCGQGYMGMQKYVFINISSLNHTQITSTNIPSL